MSSTAPASGFLDALGKSQLVEQGALAAALGRAAHLRNQPEALASFLCKEGLLTAFQARCLLQGKWRHFLIGNKYKVLDILGQGGMGSVFLCEHLGLRRLVALKKLPENKANAPGVLERFQREARAIAHLDHPNIVRALDFASEGKLHYLVMEYVDGVNLDTLLRTAFRSKPLPIDRACDYIAQAAAALQHAHEIGWVHRDIKPGNIMVDRNGTVKLLDLGLSRLLGNENDNITRQYDGDATLGTTDFVAPEQALNMRAADIRSDIYSLGGTFYFLLTGRPPFHEGSIAQKLLAHQTRMPDSVRLVRPEVSPALEKVLMKMLAKAPDQRFQAPAEVIEALGPWTADGVARPGPHEIPMPGPLVRGLLPGSSLKQAPRGSGSSVIRSSSTRAGAAPSGSAQAIPETVIDHSANARETKRSGPSKPAKSKPARPKRAATSKSYLMVGGSLAAGLIVLLLGAWWVLSSKATSTMPARGLARNTDPARAATNPDQRRAEPTSPPARRETDGLPLVDAADARAHVGKQVRVRFQVKHAGSSQELNFLNSEKDYRKSTNFTVVIPKSVVPEFAKLGFADVPSCFVDKLVEVRGTVTIYSRTDSVQIKVEDPKFLEVLD